MTLILFAWKISLEDTLVPRGPVVVLYPRSPKLRVFSKASQIWPSSASEQPMEASEASSSISCRAIPNKSNSGDLAWERLNVGFLGT